MTQCRSQRMLVLSITLFILLASSTAQAVGYGPYFEYGRGIGVQEGFGLDFDFDENRYGVGFALDTAVARDRLFNYRLNVGYQHTQRTFDFFGISPKSKFNGVTLNNMFGFGVYRDSNVRVWLGPSIRFNADILSDAPDGLDVVDLGIGGGLALGVNVHTGDLGSAAFTFGYQYLYVGEIVTGEDDDFDTRTIDGREHLISLNFSFLFRSGGDRYYLGRKR
jgi:hypothetical protein